MASITKQANGSYRAVIYVGRDADGKMLRESVTRPTRKAVADEARKIEQRVKDGNLNDVASMTLEAYLNKWLDVNCPSLAPTTAKAYRMYTRLHIIPALGKIRLEKLAPLNMQKYFADKLKLGLTTNTLLKHYWFLSRALREALRHNSPLIGVKPPVPVDFDPKVLMEADFHKLWEILQGTPLELPFLLGAWCGLRLGEIGALKWNDMATAVVPVVEGGTAAMKERLILNIDESMSIEEIGGKYTTKGPKSKRGKRTIIAPEAVRALIEKLPRGGDTDRIFTVRPDTMSKQFHKAIVQHNAVSKFENMITEIRFHDLRHYHATDLWKNGFDARFSADRLGHDIDVMQKRYTHMDSVYKQATEARISALYSAISPTKKVNKIVNRRD